MFCPVCGVANPAHGVTCAACGSHLDVFARTAPDNESHRCPRCGRLTPSLAAGRAAYCMRCGKPLRAALAVLPATPDPDRCPLCQQTCASVKAAFRDSPDDLARLLAPPRRPLAARLFGVEGEPPLDGLPRATARRKLTAPSLASRAASQAYTLLVWTLGALAVALLLLAMNKLGSYRELTPVIQSGGSVGAVVSARVAASLPFLLGALAAFGSALGLLAIRATLDTLRKAPAIAYRRARQNWDAAHFCPTDRIVFFHTTTAVHWDPVEDLQQLIARER